MFYKYPPKGAGVRQPKKRIKLKTKNENKMENQPQIRKTPMQELIEIILLTKESLSKDEKFKGYDYTLNTDIVINLLKNSFAIESAVISNAFDYGYLQAELKHNAEVTNGNEYVTKFFKKDENISSQV